MVSSFIAVNSATYDTRNTKETLKDEVEENTITYGKTFLTSEKFTWWKNALNPRAFYQL